MSSERFTLSAPVRLQSAVMAVLPVGDGCVVSADLRNNHLLRSEGGYDEERHLVPYRSVQLRPTFHKKFKWFENVYFCVFFLQPSPTTSSTRFWRVSPSPPSGLVSSLSPGSWSLPSSGMWCNVVYFRCMSWMLCWCVFLYRCACVSGFLKRFMRMMQWMVFAAAAAAMFAVSLVGAGVQNQKETREISIFWGMGGIQ